MALYSDLRQLKAELQIDPRNTAEDKRLGFFLETASSWIEEWLNRPGVFYKSRTEYYSGTGTPKLLLRSRPVYTTPTIEVLTGNGAGSYGAGSDPFPDSWTYGDDFCLQIDQDDGTSRSAILLAMKKTWFVPYVGYGDLLSSYKGQARGNYKITYTAGYTVDNLPAVFRDACNLIVSNLRYLYPLGVALSSDSYEDRSISIPTDRKNYIMALAKPMLLPFRNWKF